MSKSLQQLCPSDIPIPVGTIRWQCYGLVFVVDCRSPGFVVGVGNILVLVVIAVHKRMRTITNFFLANLAVADLCVGVFCILPNLSTYLTPSWLFGRVRALMWQVQYNKLLLPVRCYALPLCTFVLCNPTVYQNGLTYRPRPNSFTTR